MSFRIMTPVRALPILSFPATLRPIFAARCYATQNSLGTTPASQTGSKRKRVTMFNDDGRVSWGNLSSVEKAARTTQQTFNFGLILLGGVLTIGVGYVMYTEVFSPNSAITQFNRATTQVKNDPRCIELLGDGDEIRAFGEPTSNKWARAGPIAHHTRKDQNGTEHLIMHFNVEGPRNKGVVSLHMIKRPSEYEFEYKYLALDVKGHPKLYLENADTRADGKGGKTRIFGIQWA